jgi:hypothetical protein
MLLLTTMLLASSTSSYLSTTAFTTTLNIKQCNSSGCTPSTKRVARTWLICCAFYV